jgi:hypothetical protein
MGICCLVSITPWNPLFWMIGWWKTFQDDPIVPVMCFRMPHSHQRVEPGDNVEEQFPVKVSSNCPCWVHKLCYSSWLMAQAMHRVWVFCCALISTMPLGSNIHGDILRPYMRAQCGDFGGRSPARLWHVSVWRLMEVGGAVWKTFSIHFQYIFNTFSSFKMFQVDLVLIRAPGSCRSENDLSLRGLRGLWTISVPNSGKRYGELLQKAMRRCLFFETAFVKPLGAASCQSTS